MKIISYRRYIPFFILCWIIFSCLLSTAYADKEELNNFIVEVQQDEITLTDKGKETVLSIQQKPMVKRIRLVSLNVELLKNDNILLNLFNDVSITAHKTRVIKQDADGVITWVGYVVNEHNAVIITQQGNEVTGSVWLNNIYYSIQPLEQGIHLISEVDQSKFPPDEPEGFEEGLLKNKQNFQEILRKKGEENGGEKNHDGITSRVLIAYTTAAANAVGNTLTMSQNVITDANSSYINSSITPRLQLAYVTTVAYTESGSFQTDLDRLVNGNDGFMDQIHGLRNGSGSDFVILIIDDTSSCGLADAIYANENEAFAVVAESCMLGNHSFAHEIGHLQGGRHDPFVDNNTSPFAYGHGFTHPDLNPPDSWRTIMAYNNACTTQGFTCTRIQFWSNPNVIYRGDAMGTAQTEDNHRVLNETEYDMADFRVLPNSLSYASYNQTGEDVEAAKDSITINGQGNISNGANVTFEAAMVTLQGSFTADQGSEFHIHSGYK